MKWTLTSAIPEVKPFERKLVRGTGDPGDETPSYQGVKDPARRLQGREPVPGLGRPKYVLIPVVLPGIATESLYPAVFEIMGPKDIGVTT